MASATRTNESLKAHRKPVSTPAPTAMAEEPTESLPPIPYRGDWYAVLVWMFGAVILIALHIADLIRSILYAFDRS